MTTVRSAIQRFLLLFLAVVILIQPLEVCAAGQDSPLTPQQAVSEMTWGVNFPDLFITDVDYSDGNPVGYYHYAPFGIAIWLWNRDFQWLSTIENHQGSYNIEMPIPNYNPTGPTASWINGLFQLGIMTFTKDQRIKIELSNTRIKKTDGTEIALSTLDGIYDVTTSNDPENKGLYQCVLNHNTGEVFPGYALDGAVLHTTVTVTPVPFLSPEAKASHFYQLHRDKVDAEALIDKFLAEGANVFRLPITADGKLLDVRDADRSKDQTIVSLAFDIAVPPEGYYVKAFLLGGNHQPLTSQLQ